MKTRHTIEIRPSGDGHIDVKRFHVPFTVVSKCPTCRKTHKQDLSGPDYLQTPTIGEPEPVYFYCDPCPGVERNATEWQEHVVIDMTLRPATKEEIPT